MTRLTLVVPVYNEEAMLEAFVNQIRESLRDLTDIQWEILFVDDGSSDATPRLLVSLAQREERLRYLRLTRNFGKEAAIHAGL
ncbi:MAG: glycosyltransferase, partial [Pseudomonadota bacterium]